MGLSRVSAEKKKALWKGRVEIEKGVGKEEQIVVGKKEETSLQEDTQNLDSRKTAPRRGIVGKRPRKKTSPRGVPGERLIELEPVGKRLRGGG